jgi:hypothetical protein
MDDLRTYTAAHAGGSFAPMARWLAAAARACWKGLLVALHESRQREAMRVIARYRHLSRDAEAFYQREIGAEQARRAHETKPERVRAPRRFYIDPMQGMQ